MQKYIYYFGIPLYSWQVFLILGALIVIVASTIERPKDFPLSRAGIAFLGALIAYAGTLGAKILSIALRYPGYTALHIPFKDQVEGSGYAFLGSIPAAMVVVWLFTKARTRPVSFWTVMDYGAPFIFLHQAFMRIGCFSKGCCLGIPSDLPWACAFNDELPLRHPTQVYEIGYILLTFIVMRHVYMKRPPAGVTFFGCVFIYSFFRFFNEFLRFDSPPILGVTTLSQITMVTMCIVSGIAIINILKRRNSK
ncbi:MAG: prolipoprotein diacylglyceryl transferase [Candidatus Omnitrophica bacterium]|nr:prolipoprotein diacylglyceryl transferase [Candidatus Omnitrophota bacterium]